jgi:transcriptional regulator with XRE-family HTH domain
MAKRRIGEVIKQAREKKGLKAEEVAARCYVTRGRYYQWEAGHYIHEKNLPYLAEVLDLKLKSLRAVNGERKPSPAADEQQGQVAAA